MWPRDFGILSPDQEKALQGVASVACPNGFALVGGTALAKYYLGHRRSDDLDFYCSDAAVVESVSGKCASACESAGLKVELGLKVYGFARLTVNGMKVEFCADERMPPERQAMGAVQVMPILYIAVMKWRALAGRGSAKDVYDLWKLDGVVDLAHASDSSETASVNVSTKSWGLNEGRKDMPPVSEPPSWLLLPERWPKERQEMEKFVTRWLDRFLGRSFFTL